MGIRNGIIFWVMRFEMGLGNGAGKICMKCSEDNENYAICLTRNCVLCLPK